MLSPSSGNTIIKSKLISRRMFVLSLWWAMRRAELLTRLRALRFDLEKITDEFGLVEGAYHQDTIAEALFQLAVVSDL